MKITNKKTGGGRKKSRYVLNSVSVNAVTRKNSKAVNSKCLEKTKNFFGEILERISYYIKYLSSNVENDQGDEINNQINLQNVNENEKDYINIEYLCIEYKNLILEKLKHLYELLVLKEKFLPNLNTIILKGVPYIPELNEVLFKYNYKIINIVLSNNIHVNSHDISRNLESLVNTLLKDVNLN